MERDYVRPFEERLAFMRQFWKKRFLPPKGAMLRLEKGRYVVERVQCWPFKWGKTTAEYFWRRLSWWPRCVSRYIGLFP
jgi:hypothetical protein